jgi:glycosyltransferase involved in cell wall biosynthesis
MTETAEKPPLDRDMVVILPANRRHHLLVKRPDTLNRTGIGEGLEAQGFRVKYLDVNGRPWNPLVNKPSLFASIDPARAADVLFRYRRATAVVSYFQSGVLLVLALRRVLGFKPRVVIVDIGDDQNWKVRERIVRFCIRRADAIFTFASAQAEYLRTKYRTDTVRFITYQTDTGFYFPDPGVQQDCVLSVGSDISRDFDTMKNAVFDLGVPVVLRTNLVGEDRTKFPHVAVVRERLDDAGLRNLYRRAKVVVVPLHDTLHPGGITTLVEAFACGKAVVASNSRGIRDYLRDGENCLVVPCGDSEALKKAALRLINDRELRERLGKNARTYAENELSQPRHAQRLADAIRSLSAGNA